ncbi:MAG: leucine-rich repeat protein [Clostridia bacterium]|nr:leucine-rich repeat protein [Clostridia bacterium]
MLDKILDFLKEFAEKSKIKNGELISFDRTNLRNNDIVMIGDIKTIKDRAFYAPVAVNKATESLTICNGVEKIESCAFVTNMSKNIYIPKSVTSIETSSFYANNQSGAVLHFEIQRESRKESFARCGEFSPTGYKFGAGEYRIYKAQDNSKSPIIKKLDFILSNFNELKDYYQAEKQKILKIINENTQKLLEKEKQEFDVELKKSEEVLTEIFKLRKEFLEKAVIENGKLVEYKSSYDKEQVVYFTEDVNSFEKGLFHCYHNVKIILPSTITKLEKKSFVNNRNLELYIPKSVISLDTEAVAVYMYKGAKSLTLSFEESPYQNGFQKDYCFVSQGVVEKPKISKKGYVRNELEYYKKINPKLYNQLKNEEDRFRSELERKMIEAKLEE